MHFLPDNCNEFSIFTLYFCIIIICNIFLYSFFFLSHWTKVQICPMVKENPEAAASGFSLRE